MQFRSYQETGIQHFIKSHFICNHQNGIPPPINFLLIACLLLAFIVAGCDSQVAEPEVENSISSKTDFFAYSDTTNPTLNIAIDTLRERNAKKNFINKFVENRGYPVWDEASTFPQKGHIVMLVPVIHPQKKQVSGIVYIGMVNSLSAYHWIPRDSETIGTENSDKKLLENYMLIFEQAIFGKVQKPDVRVRIDKKPNTSSVSKFSTISYMQPITIKYNCGQTSFGEDNWTGWQCETKTVWVNIEGSGSGGSGGDGGSSGGGGFGGSGSGSDGGDDTPCGDPVHGCAHEDPIFTNGIILNNPEVKYPVNSDYAEQYPKFTEYLKNQLPTLKDNDTIINAIEKYGDLNAADIKNQLQWGKGPTIKIVQLDQYAGCDATCLGQYSSNDPNSLLIDIDLVNDLENTTVGSEIADAFSFLVGVTILHELVHFSEYTDETWNSPESGTLFEEDVYGQTVWRHNARMILKNHN